MFYSLGCNSAIIAPPPESVDLQVSLSHIPFIYFFLINCEEIRMCILTEVSCLRTEMHSELKAEKQIILFCCYEKAHPPTYFEISKLPINL